MQKIHRVLISHLVLRRHVTPAAALVLLHSAFPSLILAVVAVESSFLSSSLRQWCGESPPGYGFVVAVGNIQRCCGHRATSNLEVKKFGSRATIRDQGDGGEGRTIGEPTESRSLKIFEALSAIKVLNLTLKDFCFSSESERDGGRPRGGCREERS